MDQLITIIILLCVGYGFGSHFEKSHYKSIIKRERQIAKKPVISFVKKVSLNNVRQSQLVCGSCVISIDYFKKFIAGFSNIIGGNVVSYESLVDRARREAVLRMTEKANSYDMIVNTKIETTTIGKSKKNRKKSASAISVLVYGTAVKVEK